jgi:hypothetical protein
MRFWSLATGFANDQNVACYDERKITTYYIFRNCVINWLNGRKKRG